ncbi:MAG: 4Fe-4S binding protein [Candidatus Cloacimonadales bacterium]|jgi:polyferredoxin|nr:4Fe-4S binding protein [Candidatus Cloacimonadota bacterium]MDD3502194.1 4Fe-4S binding protein [Candidatus Cloacimonadota bacterium]MDX9976414.1 4Fe-4S binding protein [Candidatus Cloacimonadales bacterium]
MRLLLKSRKWIQLFFFIVSSILIYLFIKNTLLIVHKLCPYSVVCFGTLSFKQGGYIYPISLLIFAALTMLVMWFGRAFCGFICFFGTLQEYLYRIIPKNAKAVLKISHSNEKSIGLIKYVVLGATIILSVFGLSKAFMNYCPITTLAWIKNAGVSSLIFLVITLILSLFIERFWCRFLCPYAALMNVISKIGKFLRIDAFYIKIEQNKCIDCGACTEACPMNIDLQHKVIIKNPNCIKCLKCIDVCPLKDTIKWR